MRPARRHPARPISVEEEAACFATAIKDICDAAIPRARCPPPRRRQVHWWTEKLAGLRANCNAARRRYTRQRRRNIKNLQAKGEHYAAYREAQKILQREIRAVKDRSWGDLLQTIDGHPWGRPYLLVRNKLRSGARPLTETIHPRTLDGVVASPFPDGEVDGPFPGDHLPYGEYIGGVQQVTKEELAAAVRRTGRTTKGPGPDGVHGAVWRVATGALGDRLCGLFTACIEQGRFPAVWRRARFVLLQKEGRPPESPAAYRPICLLDEVGKLLERIIASRITDHLKDAGPDLAECQFGFREGRSTIDAISAVRGFVSGEIKRGRVCVAVSLDISNAFNSIP